MEGLAKLLENTSEAYYWVGFILADGCIVRNRLTVGLGIKDKHHVDKLARFVDYKIPNKARLAIQDKTIIPKLRAKFDIRPRKTYNPPVIKKMKVGRNYLRLALAIGFIDGDGSIRYQTGRKDCLLSIKNHATWQFFLRWLNNVIHKGTEYVPKDVRIDKEGYAVLTVSNNLILKRLKKKVLSMNLPILTRKWNRIDENYINRTEQAKIYNRKVKKLLENGYRQKDICVKLKLTKGAVSQIVKRLKCKKKIK